MTTDERTAILDILTTGLNKLKEDQDPFFVYHGTLLDICELLNKDFETWTHISTPIQKQVSTLQTQNNYSDSSPSSQVP